MRLAEGGQGKAVTAKVLELPAQTLDNWLYLAGVIDLQSRQVVGWSMHEPMQTSLLADALRMAWFRCRPAAGLIFHSNHGSQYCSVEFRAILAGYGMHRSVSRKGNCRGGCCIASAALLT